MANDEKRPTENVPVINLKQMIQQLEDLVRLALESESKEPGKLLSLIEANKQIVELRKKLELVTSAYKDAMITLGISDEEIAKIRADAREKDKDTFASLEGLEKKCEEARERVYASLKQHREAVKEFVGKSENDTKKGKGRRDKFKKVGGKKGWLPT